MPRSLHLSFLSILPALSVRFGLVATLLMATLSVVSFPVQAFEPPRYAAFSQLNTTWFVGSLQLQNLPPLASGMTEAQQLAQASRRLLLKVSKESISPQRFAQLWMDIRLISQQEPGSDSAKVLAQDFHQLSQLLQGPLLRGDLLMLERKDGATLVRLNYRQHLSLSPQFLPHLIETLAGRISPLPEMKAGLLGKLKSQQRHELLQQFDQLEPSLLRISRTNRWLRKSGPLIGKI